MRVAHCLELFPRRTGPFVNFWKQVVKSLTVVNGQNTTSAFHSSSIKVSWAKIVTYVKFIRDNARQKINKIGQCFTELFNK